MQFKEIVGQEATKQRLLNTVSENRVSHAQLFLGHEGSGSLALAVAYAQYLSCEDKQPNDSCGVCSSCRKYQKLMHPDLHFSYPFFAKHKDDTALTFIEQWRGALTTNPYLSLDIWRGYLDAENKQANINIAECHQIIKKLSFKPFESEYKILILWLPEYLDKEGNALLKIIEEPQPNTLFLLVAQNQDQILNTILSRTQLVKIPALEYDEIKEHLLSAHHQTEEAAAEIAYLSNGNMTEALAMLQQDNKSYHELFVQWLRYCFGNKGIEVMAFVDQFAKMGRENQKNFLRYGTSFIRECCLLLAGAGTLVHLPARELDTAQKMSNVLSIGKSQLIIDELEKAHYHVERNANPKILFLDVSLQIIKILINKNIPAGESIYAKLIMGCGSCSTGGGCSPAGCKSNGSCLTNGCSKLDVYDWLSHMDMPTNYKPFQVIEVKFKGSRKEFYLNNDNIYLEAGELVAVEATTGGYDIGHVSLTGELVRMQMVKRHVKEADVVKKIYRKATIADVDKWKAAKDMEWETMHKSRKLALDLNLSMKLSDVDYQGDKTKATFYYTAEGRVDFRELIKKMAETFRIRIEMRQIGMRQEASRLGGIGSCGRELCCSTWLTDFKTVSTSAARYQNLSLNTLKLAGQCGKLKCCLNYELDTYMDALKYIPDNVNVLRTQKGDARLQKTDIFKKLMWFSYPGEESWVPLPIKKVKEIQQQNKDGVIPEDLGEIVEVEATPAKVLDYENVVGQDSLTRLDERRNNNKKKNKSRNKNQKPGAQAQAEGKPANQQPQQGSGNPQERPAQQPRPEGNRQPQNNRPQGNRPPQQHKPQGEGRPQGEAKPQREGKPQGEPRPQGEAKPQGEGGGNNNRRRRPNRPNRNNNNNNQQAKPE